MNKTTHLFLAVIVSLLFLQCDQLTDFADVTFDNVLIEEVMDIDIKAVNSGVRSGEIPLSFSDSTTINLADNANDDDDNVEKLSVYINCIRSIDIKRIEFIIPDSVGGLPLENVMIDNINISINGEGVDYAETFTNIAPGTTLESQKLESMFSQIAFVLFHNKDLSVSTNGQLTGSLENFSLKIDMVADITANPLKN
jgi:hypothetical protein